MGRGQDPVSLDEDAEQVACLWGAKAKGLPLTTDSPEPLGLGVVSLGITALSESPLPRRALWSHPLHCALLPHPPEREGGRKPECKGCSCLVEALPHLPFDPERKHGDLGIQEPDTEFSLWLSNWAFRRQNLNSCFLRR